MLEKANNPNGSRKLYDKADYEPKPIYRKHQALEPTGHTNQNGDYRKHYKHDSKTDYKSSQKYPRYDKYEKSDRTDNYQKRKHSPEQKQAVEKSSERSKTFDNIDDLHISDPFKQLFKDKFSEEAKEAGDKFCELVDLRTREEAVKVFKMYCDLLFDKKTGKRIKKIEETKKIINEKLKEREIAESKVAENAKNGEQENEENTIDLTEGVKNGEKSSSDSKNDNWTKNGEKVTDLAINQLIALCFKARRCFICGEDGFENQNDEVLKYHFNCCVREHKSELIAETFCGLKFPITENASALQRHFTCCEICVGNLSDLVGTKQSSLKTQIKRINKKLGFCPVNLKFNKIEDFKEEEINMNVVEEFLQGSKSGGAFRSVATILYNTISLSRPEKFLKCVVYSANIRNKCLWDHALAMSLEESNKIDAEGGESSDTKRLNIFMSESTPKIEHFKYLPDDLEFETAREFVAHILQTVNTVSSQ
jgi:hypothetical protein